MSELCVVIPYYQREPGHLARAIRSVLRQQDVPGLSIIVVDDGSPLPAASELETLDSAERACVRLICQPNQGPGPARNTGLDAVPANAEWVAFLDSDDVWGAAHLARGLAALRQGYDFLFANLQREGDPDTHFALAGFDPAAHALLAGGPPSLFAFAGDFFTANLSCSPVGTSTVIFRRCVLGTLRFPPTRDTPGEDLLFWLKAALATGRIAFDATVQVRYGRGNITVAESWKSAKALRTTIAYARYIANIEASFPLSPAQRRIVRDMKRTNRADLARMALAMLRERKCPGLGALANHSIRHPAIFGDFVRIAARETIRRGLAARWIGAGAR